ncbi:hypothetical protein IFM89_000704 [Coptis chinensis]|uniref:Uncharacterized protein n=1 Tax=Coptis chinensis TaxID=261450 RepID=A0A835LK90_9MAGN|nr:hypothetical protein IFM89_000704 [Coptis chinensis]
MFAFEHLSSIDIDWTRNKFRLAWKEYKHELYNKYVKDQPPSIVKENPQDGIPLQDWRRFVDNCHSEKFKNTQQCHSFTHSFSRRRRVLDLSPTASFILGWTSLLIQRLHASSLRNSANRKNQKNSSCLGRKSAAVAREEMAMAKGVPESSIGRVESYKFIHKRKSGVAQDPELVVRKKLDNYTTLHPSSRDIDMDDALTQVLGPDSRGRFRGLGEGVCKTTLKKMKPVMQQNIALMEKNTSLEKKVLNEFIGKECDLRGGWPLRVVARGIVQDVDPTIEFGDRRLEEGNFKVYVNVIYDGMAALPLSHDRGNQSLARLLKEVLFGPKSC